MSREEVVERFAGFPASLRRAARAGASRPVTAGEWTPAEVVRHLIAVELEVHQARLDDLVATADPHWSWTEPGPWPGEPDASLEALIARFAELRGLTVARVRGLDEAGWARRGTHATFGALDVESLVRVAGDHDQEHLAGLATS